MRTAAAGRKCVSKKSWVYGGRTGDLDHGRYGVQDVHDATGLSRVGNMDVDARDGAGVSQTCRKLLLVNEQGAVFIARSAGKGDPSNRKGSNLEAP